MYELSRPGSPTPARATLWFGLTVLALTIGAGCGGDDGDGDAPQAVTKAAYLKQANAACEDVRRGLQGEVSLFLERRRSEVPQQVLYADVTHLVVLPTIEGEMEAVRALKAPQGEGGRIDRLLYAQQLALDQLVYEQRIPSLKAVEQRFVASGERLRDYGLPGCANGPSS